MSTDPTDLKNKNEVCVGPTSTQAGKASTCDGCPNKSDCASGKFADAKVKQDKENEEIAARLESVKNILLILSGKGGVGKSTVASQIAWSLAHWGLKVGILDIDICGPSIARMMGVENQNVHQSSTGWSPVYTTNGYDNEIDNENNENNDESNDESNEISLCVMSIAFLLQTKNDAIIWRGPRKTGLIRQFLCDVEWNELDFLIIDSPPGTSDEHISIQQFLNSILKSNNNGNTNTIVNSIIVSTPQEVSLLDVRKEISFCKKVKLPILGIIENMSYFICPCCNNKSEIFMPTTGGVKKMCKDEKQKYLGDIPIDPNLLKCCDAGFGYLKYWEDQVKIQNNKNNNKHNDGDNDNGDLKMDENDQNNISNTQKGNVIPKENITYSSIVSVIDNIMLELGSNTQSYVKEIKTETEKRRNMSSE